MGVPVALEARCVHGLGLFVVYLNAWMTRRLVVRFRDDRWHDEVFDWSENLGGNEGVFEFAFFLCRNGRAPDYPPTYISGEQHVHGACVEEQCIPLGQGIQHRRKRRPYARTETEQQ
jgi:hypothetical protein